MDMRHPDRNALERFSHGATSEDEERWIENHLRSGCAICQQEVDDLLRRTLGAVLAEPGAHTGRVRDDGEGGYLSWEGLFAQLEQRLAQVTAERGEAPALLAELLAQPPAERQSQVRNRLRFRTLAVC